MHDLGWSHTKIYLTCITLFLTPRQPSLRKAQMERHTLPTGPMDSFMGPNSLWVKSPEDKLRDDNFLNGVEKINTLNHVLQYSVPFYFLSLRFAASLKLSS